MAIPIAPTPYLKGASAQMFDKVRSEMERKAKEKLIIPSVDWGRIHQLQQEILQKKQEAGN